MDKEDMMDCCQKTPLYGQSVSEAHGTEDSCNPGPPAQQTNKAHRVPDNARILTNTPATHIAYYGGVFWGWTGASWRPAMRFEAGLARELLRKNERAH